MSDSKANGVSRRTFLIGMAGLACVKLPLPARAATTSFEPFSFAVVSDIHLTTDRADSFILFRETQLFLQDVVRQLNDEKPDFVLFAGDQVELLGKDQSNWQLFLDVAQGLDAPWSFLLGEHDITDELPVDKVKTFTADWKGRGIDTDRPYWSQNPLPGVHIVGLDTSRPNSNSSEMSFRQLAWLKQDLADNKTKITIVFSHHPLLPPTPYDGGPPWDDYILPQGPAVREVLGANPQVALAVSGHVYVSKVQREKDIWYVSCPALAVYPCGFRIFRVTPDGITVASRQISFPALVKKARKALAESSLAFQYDRGRPEGFVDLAEGGRLDNDALMPLAAGKEARELPRARPKKQKKARGTKGKKVPLEKKP